jgi:hypothetical protein
MSDTTPQTPPKRSGARIFMVVTGLLAGLLSIGLIGLGALALWGDSETDERGYLNTDSERFAAPTRALATENLDLDMDGVESILDAGDLDELQLEVTPESGKPVFVGVARTDAVSAYLRSVAHTTVTDISSDPFEVSYEQHAGERRPAAPAGRSIWAASAQGDGAQRLSWDLEEGDWSVVVMNADGSSGVEANISAGAKAAFLDELGWTLAGAGLLLLGGAVILVVLGTRPPRSRPSGTAGATVAPAAG